MLESTDEDEDSSRSTSVITPGVAMHYLNELRYFAIHHQNSELLNSTGQSALAVEKTSTQNMKQTKLFNYFVKQYLTTMKPNYIYVPNTH